MGRHQLTEKQWWKIRELLPPPRPPGGRGRRPADVRVVFNAILWILKTGAPWRDLPRERFGPWETVYGYFNRWSKEGRIEQILDRLQEQANEQEKIDWDLWCIDGSVVRAHRVASGARRTAPAQEAAPTRPGPLSRVPASPEPWDHGLGRSRGGLSTKLHLVTDGNGLPLAVAVSPGQRHESTCFEATIRAVRLRRGPGQKPRSLPTALAADKAYSAKRIRDWLRVRRTERVIPQRSDQEGRRGGHRKFDKAKYRRRNVVERCIGWLKESRRVATRYEKLARNYLGMLKLAMIERFLRLLV